MIPPTVTTCAEHIREDLKVFGFELVAEEIIKIKTMASG